MLDFFETYVPIAQWTIVCLMLICKNLLGLKPKLTTAFFHETRGKDKKVYVEMPFGFKQHGSIGKVKVFCLKKTFNYTHAKVLVQLLKSLVIVAYLKLLLTPASSLINILVRSVMLIISSFWQEMFRILLIWLSSCILKELPRTRG